MLLREQLRLMDRKALGDVMMLSYKLAIFWSEVSQRRFRLIFKRFEFELLASCCEVIKTDIKRLKKLM